jgi:hypothetical protein
VRTVGVVTVEIAIRECCELTVAEGIFRSAESVRKGDEGLRNLTEDQRKVVIQCKTLIEKITMIPQSEG